jgi:hypothetical protein
MRNILLSTLKISPVEEEVGSGAAVPKHVVCRAVEEEGASDE